MNDLWRFRKFCFFIQGDQQHRLLFILFPFNIRSPDTCLLHVDLLSKFSLAGQGSGLHYTHFYWNSYIGTSINYKRKMWMAPTNSQQRILSHQLILLFEFTNKINMYHDTMIFNIKQFITYNIIHWKTSRKLCKSSNLPTTGNKTILYW